MSNHLLPAQALSIDLLRSILKWIIKEQWSPFLGVICEVSHLKELLAVSSTWRQAALEFLWRKLSLTIDITTNEVRLYRPEWVRENMLPHNTANLAKEIRVSVPMSGIVSGIAHKLLVDYIGKTTCFPFAYKFTLEVTDYKSHNMDSNDIAIANALEFANLLKSVTPAAITIEVACRGGQWHTANPNVNLVSNLDEETLVTLANVLYAKTKRARLNMFTANVKSLSTIDHIPLLSSLRLNCENFPDVGTSLVHKSASTLQCLMVRIRDANMLVYDVNGEAAIYPNLQYLHMYGYVRSSPDAKEITTKKAPFSVLRMLKLYSSYPFHDDILFRGNTATLEYLDFGLDYDTILMLNQSRVFESKKMVLRHVVVHKVEDRENIPLVSEAHMSKFLNNLVGAAERLTMSDSAIARACITAAQHGQKFRNIKVLDIGYDCLSVFDLLSLLKVLPALVHFRGRISGLGTELENISAKELPDYVASTYCDIGMNLRVWKMQYPSRQGVVQAIDYLVLLALASPKLRRIEVMGNTVEDCHTRVAEALSSGQYIKYESQLYRVINALCQ